MRRPCYTAAANSHPLRLCHRYAGEREICEMVVHPSRPPSSPPPFVNLGLYNGLREHHHHHHYTTAGWVGTFLLLLWT